MKHSFYIFFFSLLSLNLVAQVRVSGTIKTKKNEPAVGVAISIKDSYDGTLSDSTGKFSFKTSEHGQHSLEVRGIGYKTINQPITIDKEPITVNLTIQEEINELNAVVITAGSFEASDRKRAVAVLNTLDIVTTGGSNADITKAINTLPGAQRIGEQEGLFVRGGTGAETKQFIDGTMVNNPYGANVPNIASRGRFSPLLFKGTIFSTGGYSALYGQALSSALILESIDLPEKSQATASISPIFNGIGYQHLTKNKNSSWGFNYGYTNLALYFNIVPQAPDYFKIPAFQNLDANYRKKTKGGIFKFYTTFSTGNIGLRRPDIDSLLLKDAFSIKNINWYNNISWKENLGNFWKITLGAGFSYNTDEIRQDLQTSENKAVFSTIDYLNKKSFMLNAQQNLSQVKIVFEKKLASLNTIRFGGEYWYAHSLNKYNNYQKTLNDNFVAFFGETDVYLSNNLAVKAGIRIENSSLLQKTNSAPRLSLAYKLGRDLQSSLAYGQFYQKPEDTYLVFNQAIGYTKATHYIANIQKVTEFYTLRLEGFYKTYNNLVKTSPDTNTSGNGYAKGIELFWRDRKTFKNVDYWISYSYLDTKRNFLNFPQQMQPNFAANHTLNLVVKRFVLKWKTGFNFTYSLASGRPYYYLQPSADKYILGDNGKLSNYNSLDFSLNYLPNLGNTKKKASIVWVASLTNVLNQKQVYGYNYNYYGTYKQEINPPANRIVFIGCFISWGVDRSQDAINSNL